MKKLSRKEYVNYKNIFRPFYNIYDSAYHSPRHSSKDTAQKSKNGWKRSRIKALESNKGCDG